MRTGVVAFILLLCRIMLAGEAEPKPLVASVRMENPLRAPETSAVFPAERSGVIPQLAVAPRIDGTINSTEWKDAGLFCGFNTRSKFAASPTVVRAGRDATTLFLAFRCALPSGTAELSKSTKRDLDVWQDEAVEIFIDPNRSKKTYYQFIVNTLGTQQDSKGFQSSFNAAWDSKTRVEKDFWEVEVAIPFSAVGGAPETPQTAWGINFCRNDRRSGEHSSWSHLVNTAHDPARFATMTFDSLPKIDLQFCGASIPKIGMGHWRLCSISRGDEPLKLRLTLRDTARQVTAAPLDVEIPPGVAEHRVPCDYKADGQATMTIDAVTQSGETVPVETIFLRVITPTPLRILARENESYLSEKTFMLRVQTECDDIASTSLQMSLQIKNNEKPVRLSAIKNLPSAEFTTVLAVDGLEAGVYVIGVAISDKNGNVLGKEMCEFVRGRGPFE
jgi:hypothetical protein